MTSEQFEKYMKEKYGSTIKFEKVKIDLKTLLQLEKEFSAQVEKHNLGRKIWIEEV